MAFLHDDVLDAALGVVSAANALHICSQEPTTYVEATTTYSLGSKSVPQIGSIEDATPDGRKVTVAAINDGAVSADGTATHWALVDTTGSRLLATEALTAPQAVTNGNPFTLTAFDIRFPDPA